MQEISFYRPGAINLPDGCSFPVFHFNKELIKLAPEIEWTIIDKPMAMLDCHVAQAYGKQTKNFNTQVERNLEYFKTEWRFQPGEKEWRAIKDIAAKSLIDVAAKCSHISEKRIHLADIFGSTAKSRSLPWFYTKSGINMAAFFQKTPLARMRAIYIVETFDALERVTFDPETDPYVQAYLQKILAEKAANQLSPEHAYPSKPDLPSNMTADLIHKLNLFLESMENLFPQRTALEDAMFITDRLAERFRLSEEKKQSYLAFLLKSKNFPLPEEALILEGPHYLTLSEIASKAGIFSLSGRPHAQAIGRIMKEMGLDTDEYRKYFRFEKNGHMGASYQYLDLVIPKIQEWIEEKNWPETLKLAGDKREQIFQVRYERKNP